MSPHDPHAPRDQANSAYPAFQIARALAAVEHADPQIRQSAAGKASRWRSVLSGMLAGTLHIGSRKPLADLPTWVTPEVITGGFATGGLMAGGELQPHERALSGRIAPEMPEPDRSVLNRYYLTEPGLAELTRLLESGCYRVTAPEEGALLTVAWLVDMGHAAEASELVEEILPHFATLRFFPQPSQQPAPFGPGLFLESIGQVRERLSRAETPRPILVQKEAITHWVPLFHRMVTLFLETVEGEHPAIQPDAEGCWTDPASGGFHTTGGWPCRSYPADWRSRAVALLEEIATAEKQHRANRRPLRAGDAFARLRDLLTRCAADPAALNGRDVGSIRLILARHLTRHGSPDSERARLTREAQLRQVRGPWHSDLAAAVEQRLAEHPAQSGLEDTGPLLQPVTAEEAARTGLPAGSTVPASVARKVRRCLIDTPAGLISRRIVTSGETLARIIPSYTASLRAQAFPDPRAARLYASVDVAFRARRSVLLLNLESQVKLAELPWVKSLERHRPADVTTQSLARQALKDLATLTLSSFPQAILPNHLLKDFRALVQAAGIGLPLTEELAADIFMGDFAAGFSSAARMAAAGSVVPDSVYSRYYRVDYPELLRRVPEPAPAKPHGGAPRPPQPRSPLVILCEESAALPDDGKYSVAKNGVILEQAQIVTTHNLAGLFEIFDLAHDPALNLAEMAEHCFRWICQRQQVPSPNPHARLIMLKNTAYAWRQMIFYLAAIPARQVDDFLVWAKEHLSQQTPDFRIRFEPVLAGLHQAHAAGPGGKAPEEIVRFTGWTPGNHPLW